MRWQRRQSRDSKQRGQGLVELAIVLPILLMILLATIDLGRAFYTYVALTNGAREAASYASIYDAPASISQVQQEFASDGNDGGCAAGTLTFSGSGGGRGYAYTVNVSCTFTLITPFIGAILNATGNQITIKSTATFIWE